MLNPEGGARALPTARELAEVHHEGQLLSLKNTATLLDDVDAAKLFAEALREWRRLQVERALALPALVRQREEQYREQAAELDRIVKAQPRATFVLDGLTPLRAEQSAQGMAPPPLIEPFVAGQSVDPSE